MTTPNLAIPEMPQNTMQPSVVFNLAMQVLDAMAQPVAVAFAVNAPPTTVNADAGKRWIVGNTPTGAFAGHARSIALCTAANVWVFLLPKNGFRFWVLAESKDARYNGAEWALIDAGGGSGGDPESPIIDDATTAYTVLNAHSNAYRVMSAAGAKTVTVGPQSGEALGAKYEQTFDNFGAGDLTFVEGAGVTIEPQQGATLVLKQGGVAMLKRLSENVFRLAGNLELAE